MNIILSLCLWSTLKCFQSFCLIIVNAVVVERGWPENVEDLNWFYLIQLYLQSIWSQSRLCLGRESHNLTPPATALGSWLPSGSRFSISFMEFNHFKKKTYFASLTHHAHCYSFSWGDIWFILWSRKRLKDPKGLSLSSISAVVFWKEDMLERLQEPPGLWKEHKHTGARWSEKKEAEKNHCCLSAADF